MGRREVNTCMYICDWKGCSKRLETDGYESFTQIFVPEGVESFDYSSAWLCKDHAKKFVKAIEKVFDNIDSERARESDLLAKCCKSS